jgi:hypothetical protein
MLQIPGEGGGDTCVGEAGVSFNFSTFIIFLENAGELVGL